MTTNRLHAELAQASVSLKRCGCGGKVVMSYAPGCTYITCLAERGTKMAMPDFHPAELARMWNERNAT